METANIINLIGIGLLVMAGILITFPLSKFLKSYLLQKKETKQFQDRTLYLIQVPKHSGTKEEQNTSSRDLSIAWTGIMEQFLASMAGIYEGDWQHALWGQEHISLEILSKGGQINFFVSCPGYLSDLIEKQIHSFFHGAQIQKAPAYNLFDNINSADYLNHTASAQLGLSRSFVYPLRTYKDLEHDSLNNITTALSKMGNDSNAAIQILIRPSVSKWQKKCEEKIKSMYEDKKPSGVQGFASEVGKAAFNPQKKDNKPDIQAPPTITANKEQEIGLIQKKASKVGFDAKVRLIVVSSNINIAKSHLQNLLNSFAQFTDQGGNRLQKLKFPFRNIQTEVFDFVLRRFGSPNLAIILNTEELATLYHFPNKSIATPNIQWLSAKTAAAPANTPTEGRLLGENIYRGEKRKVYIKDSDRMRHLYCIGKTGVGKTTLFTNMIIDDIAEGKGVCYIDPHGDAAQTILQNIPKERAEDVIYFDPGDITRPMGLNLLEWNKPEQRDFLVQEATQIFYKLFDPNQTGIVGPQFEHWLRNAALTLMSYPEGGTLIEIPRLFTDKKFEQERLKHVSDPMVRAFWEKQLKQTSDFHKSEMLNYFVSKFGRFMTNDMMRNIIGQTKSAFDFREVMDSGKILVLNLSKGKLGEVNAELLGLITVAKLAMAAYSRADSPEEQRKPFYLYVDEFQNFTTSDFSSILSEARKYQLSLNITNQYIEQLDEKIRNAVFGNVGSIISFRIGVRDAEFLEREFTPTFSQEDLVDIDKYNAYIKLLIDGAASDPFSIKTIAPKPPQSQQIYDAVQKISKLKYGKNQQVVDEEIRKRSAIEEVVREFGSSSLSKEPTPNQQQ
ncbi:type IV secretory system conjugative DNA transfer family protein [Patescibacteria group bacterium]